MTMSVENLPSEGVVTFHGEYFLLQTPVASGRVRT
jgi:hypothetical protein